ncbi:MAG: hypothetical protein QF464_10265 [Myxococcota bacterium]|nr:hypothetical protein [Myxococcota bacterium]
MKALLPALILAVSLSLAGLVDTSAVAQTAPQGGVYDHQAQMSLPAAEPTMGSCWNCSGDSSGSCAPQSGKVRMQCEGSRSDCTKKGCKINGSSSCSSAGNVGKC